MTGEMEIRFERAAGGFGPGWRANATIGRAIRLIMLNLVGTKPGVVSMSTMGHPGRYTYRIGEYEEVSSWEALSVERGFDRGTSGRDLEPQELSALRRHAVRDRTRARQDDRRGSMVEGGREAASPRDGPPSRGLVGR